MNPSEVLRRLCKEKKEWKHIGRLTPEVNWTLNGIDLCLKHVRDIIREQRIVERFKYPKVDHRHATKLYYACKGAHHELKLSNRAAALKILHHAIDKVPVGFHGKTHVD
jgi:hypothetical protein